MNWALDKIAALIIFTFPYALYLLNEFWIGICMHDVLGDKGVSYGGNVTFVPWPSDLWPWNSLLLWVSRANADFGLVFAGMMYLGAKVCRVVESWCFDLGAVDLWPWNFHLLCLLNEMQIWIGICRDGAKVCRVVGLNTKGSVQDWCSLTIQLDYRAFIMSRRNLPTIPTLIAGYLKKLIFFVLHQWIVLTGTLSIKWSN
jgi:hypothetical protein